MDICERWNRRNESSQKGAKESLCNPRQSQPRLIVAIAIELIYLNSERPAIKWRTGFFYSAEIINGQTSRSNQFCFYSSHSFYLFPCCLSLLWRIRIEQKTKENITKELGQRQDNKRNTHTSCMIIFPSPFVRSNARNDGYFESNYAHITRLRSECNVEIK